MRPETSLYRPAALLLVVCLAGCTASAPPATVPETALEPHVGLEVRWVRTSAEHDAVYRQVYGAATERLEELARGREPGTWAVSLDVDETVLDNSLYQLERYRAGEGYTPESWFEWVEREKATELPGVRGFLERARELGGAIALVTNRKAPECPATERNLDALGLPYDVVLCRTDERSKEGRWAAVAEGTASEDLGPLDILLWVGDNIHDFPGGTQELRHEGAEAFEAFGERFFVVPNPMYGSWTDNPVE